MQNFAWRIAAAYLLSVFATAVAADSPIDVRVKITGEEVRVDASFYVPATPREVWAVITDYDSATSYVSNLEKSVIVSRNDNVLVVSQKASKGFGPFRISVESLKEIRLTPYEKTESRGVGGSMKKYAASTRLVPQGVGTLLVYRADSIPDVWLPPLIGETLVESETRTRLEELRGEILRRKALKPAAAAAPGDGPPAAQL